MYEHHTHRLLEWPAFLRRASYHLGLGALVIGVGVGIGTTGYHFVGKLAWIDAFLNAAMILSGMGPVDRMTGDGAKMFAALYALFSGLVFVSAVGFVVAPWLHRLLHAIHFDEGN